MYHSDIYEYNCAIATRSRFQCSAQIASRAAPQALVNERIPAIKGVMETEVIDMLHGYKFDGSWAVPAVSGM